MAQVQERRRRQRIDVALPIKIEYNKEKLISTTKNISVLGAYIEYEKEIPLGTPLEIKIRVPQIGRARKKQSVQISCAGTSFRCQPIISPAASLVSLKAAQTKYGVGIFFRTFQGKGEKILSRYIDYILKQEKKLGEILIRERKQRLLKRKGEN